LQQQRQDLNCAIAAVRSEARKAKRQAKDATKAAAKAWQLSDFLLHATLIIYVLTDYKMEPAIKFLAANGRKRHWPEKSDEECEGLVECLFLEADLTDLVAWTDLEDPADIDAMRAALVYVQQWGLVEWARRLNSECGVAPSTESVLQRLEDKRQGVPVRVRPSCIGSSSTVKGRMWASSWRRRWGGRHGRIRIQDDVSMPELRQKDTQKCNHVLTKNDKGALEMRTISAAGIRPLRSGRNPAAVQRPPSDLQ